MISDKEAGAIMDRLKDSVAAFRQLVSEIGSAAGALPGLSPDDVNPLDVEALARAAVAICEFRGETIKHVFPLLLATASTLYRDTTVRPNDAAPLVATLLANFEAVPGPLVEPLATWN